MIVVRIDESMIPAEIRALPEVVNEVIRELAEEARNEIMRQAMAVLGTSFDDYVAGLQPVVLRLPSSKDGARGQIVATIVLTGMMPNMIESGWPGGDMKPFLLAGRNARTTKDGGRVNVVPFRHMGPETSGRHGQAMGSQYADLMGRGRAQELGERVFAKVKKLRGQKKRLPAGVGGAGLLRPYHKTDLYAGMVRERKQYKTATGSQFKTFRAVSDKSDPASWIHPGIEARHFFKEAADYVDRTSRAVLNHVVGKLGS